MEWVMYMSVGDVWVRSLCDMIVWITWELGDRSGYENHIKILEKAERHESNAVNNWKVLHNICSLFMLWKQQ